MEPIKSFGEWVSPADDLPPDDMEVIVKIDYNPDANFVQLAVMYRKDGEWLFVGSNANPYRGKYIKYWLRSLYIP